MCLSSIVLYIAVFSCTIAAFHDSLPQAPHTARRRQWLEQKQSSSVNTSSTTAIGGLPKKILEPLESSKLQRFLRKSRPGAGHRNGQTKLVASVAAVSIPQPNSSDIFSNQASHLNPIRYQREDETETSGKLEEIRNALATDVSTLRDIFGENRNKFWGDLDNETARKLYHTLLPRVLLRVKGDAKNDITPDELAHLAYQARVAAKQYARERCNVPGRIFAMAFDGFRHFKKYGKWSSKGMSWDEVWEKYALEIQEEILMSSENIDGLTRSDLTKQVCLRILERSCKTNDAIDRMFLKEEMDLEGSDRSDIILIARRFDQEINNLIETALDDDNGQNQYQYQRIIPFDSKAVAKLTRTLSIVTKKRLKQVEKKAVIDVSSCQVLRYARIQQRKRIGWERRILMERQNV